MRAIDAAPGVGHSSRAMTDRTARADYGFDAPYVPLFFSLCAFAFLGAGELAVAAGHPGTALLRWGLGAFFALNAASFVYATRTGKFRVWDELLDGLSLRGDERAVDLGCGRGARVLVFPGGDLDALKPWSRRNEVVFGERAGFIRVALRARAPIVPVVSAGGHEGFRVLPGGAAIARALAEDHLVTA